MSVTDSDDTTEIRCPRCGLTVQVRFYGPCLACREELHAAMSREAAEVEEAVYEPKMNVVPNQVATKD